MNTKLTLSLDKEIIEKAKNYARDKQISLSALIENYLQKLLVEYTESERSKGSIVDELSGIIELDADYDYKADYTDYLNKKYQ